MKRLRDENGTIIEGMVKSPVGSIIVQKSKDYQQYMQEREQLGKINKLTEEVESLKMLVQQLLEKQGDTI